MPTPVLAAETSGARIYRLGRAGWDPSGNDAGGAYTAVLKTDKVSPAGEDGLCYFRRVALRVWHTGAFTITMKVYVDGVQTKTYNANGVLQSQTISIVQAAPTTSPQETVVEGSIQANGTFIEVEITVSSANVTGVFLPESLEVGHLPLRPSKARTGAEAS